MGTIISLTDWRIGALVAGYIGMQTSWWTGRPVKKADWQAGHHKISEYQFVFYPSAQAYLFRRQRGQRRHVNKARHRMAENKYRLCYQSIFSGSLP